MGLVRGNPIMIVTLFFGAAVVSMGGVYALIPSLLRGPSLLTLTVAGALAISLGFSVLVVARTFWVVTRANQ